MHSTDAITIIPYVVELLINNLLIIGRCVRKPSRTNPRSNTSTRIIFAMFFAPFEVSKFWAPKSTHQLATFSWIWGCQVIRVDRRIYWKVSCRIRQEKSAFDFSETSFLEDLGIFSSKIELFSLFLTKNFNFPMVSND